MIYQISHTRGKQRGARGGFELLNSPTGHPHRLLSCQPVSLHPTQATKVSFSGWFINCQTWIQNSHPALKEMQNRSFTRICCSSSAISGKSFLKTFICLWKIYLNSMAESCKLRALHVEPGLFYPPNLSLQVFWTNFLRKSLRDLKGFILFIT